MNLKHWQRRALFLISNGCTHRQTAQYLNTEGFKTGRERLITESTVRGFVAYKNRREGRTWKVSET